MVGLTVLGLSAAGLAALPPGPAEAALPSQCVTTGVTVTCTFTKAQGSSFSLTIPDAVTSIQVHAVGERGGNSAIAPGGAPAVVDATFPTSDGYIFQVQFRNDGGAPGTSSAGRGGGSTTVARPSGPLVLPLIQAAGGGGAAAGPGSVSGAAGGGHAGLPGQDGTQEFPDFFYRASHGNPGTQGSGGSGGQGGEAPACMGGTYQGGTGAPGGSAAGGSGGTESENQYGGGGGGGGRYGGGGGGGGAIGCNGFYPVSGAGGGGGSSFVPSGGTSGITTSESALVRIVFTLRPRSVVAPTTVNFGSREIGISRSSLPVTVTNTGSAPLAIGTATISGPRASSFAKATDGCSGTSVPVGGSCSIALRFDPSDVSHHTATLTIPSNSATSPNLVSLSGDGTPPTDLKVLGIGSLYSPKDQTVTRGVTGPDKLMTYKLGILNEDTLGRTYKVRLTRSGSPAIAQVWTTGLGAKELLTDSSGNYVTPVVAAGKVVTLALKVTPTEAGQHLSRVEVDLLTDFGAVIEKVATETNTPAPAKGTSGYELTAAHSSQPDIGGPVDGQTATGPALNVGSSVNYSLRLKNDSTAPTSIGLRITDVDGCAGSFTTAVKVGLSTWTNEAFAGTYVTPVRTPGQYTTVTVTVKRATAGCANHKLRIQSLNAGVPVRTSYLLTNAAYVAATD